MLPYLSMNCLRQCCGARGGADHRQRTRALAGTPYGRHVRLGPGCGGGARGADQRAPHESAPPTHSPRNSALHTYSLTHTLTWVNGRQLNGCNRGGTARGGTWGYSHRVPPSPPVHHQGRITTRMPPTCASHRGPPSPAAHHQGAMVGPCAMHRAPRRTWRRHMGGSAQEAAIAPRAPPGVHRATQQGAETHMAAAHGGALN